MAEIEIINLDKTAALLDALKTDRNIGKDLNKIVADAIRQARREVTKDAKNTLDNDPRKAYKAVRNSVYKRIFGGQVNILAPRKAGRPKPYEPARQLREGQRGGNRRKRSDRTNQIDSYYGKDRGFILRFLNAGTGKRQTRYGSRGQISARNWFKPSSEQHMQQAAERISDNIDRAIQELWNQG